MASDSEQSRRHSAAWPRKAFTRLSSWSRNDYTSSIDRPSVASEDIYLGQHRSNLSEFATDVTASSVVGERGQGTDDESSGQSPLGVMRGRPTIQKQSWSSPSMNKWRVPAACLQCLANGANDAAPGAIIPSAQAYYRVSYSVISTVFVAVAIGFITAAFLVDAVDRKFGRSKTLMFAEFCCIIGCSIIISTPPFPAFTISYFFIGFGQALNLAVNNVFCANLAGATAILGLFHGLYGFGGTISPIIATAMISAGIIFTRYYIFMLCLRVISLVFAGWAFHNMEADARQWSHNAGAEDHSNENIIDDRPSKLQVLSQALRKRVTIIGALFIFAYQGAEVTDASWISSFLIHIRHGVSVTYVPSGFWAGITIGRLLLSWVAFHLGEEVRLTHAFIFAAVGMQLLTWFVPNVVGSAVSVSLVGLCIGPIYPCATTVFTSLLDRSLQESSVAFITSMGSAGGAIWPLVTGIISQVDGTWVMNPICVGLLVAMQISWGALTWGRWRKQMVS